MRCVMSIDIDQLGKSFWLRIVFISIEALEHATPTMECFGINQQDTFFMIDVTETLIFTSKDFKQIILNFKEELSLTSQGSLRRFGKYFFFKSH
eukprot:snap_masked-scaffold_5-processed-gene-1.29-mRNA-1 protein AED:1.00 eAED:1.00 QI:0/0/0/0/1/1/2/0/93